MSIVLMSVHERLTVALGYATHRTVLDCSWHTRAAVAGLQLAVVSTMVHTREVMHLVCTSATPMSRIPYVFPRSAIRYSAAIGAIRYLATGSLLYYFKCRPWHLMEFHVPSVLSLAAGEAGKRSLWVSICTAGDRYRSITCSRF